MKKRAGFSALRRAIERSIKKLRRVVVRAPKRVAAGPLAAAVKKRRPAPSVGEWLSSVAIASCGARRYQVYVPSHASARPMPMMVMLHGCRQDPGTFARSTRMNRLAEAERFVVLYPEQDRLANAQGCWNWFETRSGRAQAEAAIIMQAIDQVIAQFPVDESRIAVCGLSAGGSMAALLAISYPERFGAVVVHSGVPPGTAHSTMTALGAMAGRRASAPLDGNSESSSIRPPLLVIHGTSDVVVSSKNADAAVKQWADAGHAEAGIHRRMQRGKRHPMTVTDFKRRGELVATLVSVDRLAHAWSGGAAKQAYSDPLGPDASRLAWSFASKQFRKPLKTKISPS